MLRLQFNISPIEIELHSPLQLEHACIQNVHTLCSQNDYNVSFNRSNTSIVTNSIRWGGCCDNPGHTPDPRHTAERKPLVGGGAYKILG
jgi:hypothetical protein